MVLQLLLRKRTGNLPEEEWQRFLTLQSHIEDMKKDTMARHSDLTTWETVQLMSQAVSSYSGSLESLDVIQAVTARVGISTGLIYMQDIDLLVVLTDSVHHQFHDAIQFNF